MESFRLNDSDLKLLERYMKENNLSNKSEAIREIIRKSVSENDLNNFIYDINMKVNRLIHNQFLTKKLVEQFFVNMGFKKNLDTESNECLKKFFEKYNSYGNKFLG